MADRPIRHEPAPHQNAAFDQNFARLSDWVDQLIGSYQNIRTEDLMPRALDIAGLTGWLVEEFGMDHGDLAELLTVAVVRLAERRQADHG